jgi:hypothetical protein
MLPGGIRRIELVLTQANSVAWAQDNISLRPALLLYLNCLLLATLLLLLWRNACCFYCSVTTLLLLLLLHSFNLGFAKCGCG